MVNLTISLSDETVRKLRKAVHERYADKKGALSGIIEESVRERLEAFEAPQVPQTFKALKGNRTIAESSDLDGLAKKLEEMKINPRSVRIVSSRKLAPVVKMGLRSSII